MVILLGIMQLITIGLLIWVLWEIKGIYEECAGNDVFFADLLSTVMKKERSFEGGEDNG